MFESKDLSQRKATSTLNLKSKIKVIHLRILYRVGAGACYSSTGRKGSLGLAREKERASI